MAATVLRALVYAAVFVGVVLVLLPAEVLRRTGVSRPPVPGLTQYAGAAITIAGAAVCLSCVLIFALVGRGTPAPFDPPRRLVTSGPYRFVRNPMYLGADLAVAGAALFYESAGLIAFLLAFIAVQHAFIVLYEEPALRRAFGESYEEYTRTTGRWLPRLRP